MKDEELKILLDKAASLKSNGEIKEAIEIYSQIFDGLVQESVEYARKEEGVVIDNGDTRTILPRYFDKADEYLRRDKIACTVANNIGVALAEIGDIEGAIKMLDEAIRLTPDGLVYEEPKINKERIKTENGS